MINPGALRKGMQTTPITLLCFFLLEKSPQFPSKEIFTLRFLFFFISLFHLLELLQLVVLQISAWQWLIFQNATSATLWWQERKKQPHRAACHNIYQGWMLVSFRVEDTETWQRKNKTPLCQNTSWRWFPSAALVSTAHKFRAAPGLKECLWSHRAVRHHPSKQHTEPPNIKQARLFQKGYTGFWRPMRWVK